jgi:hypothetical protein
MYATTPGVEAAEWISRIAGIAIVAMILTITVFVIVEVIVSEDIDMVHDITTIPRWVYLMFLVILMMASAIWLLSEWYMDRWRRYATVYNLGAIYAVMIITTFALLVFHLASGRALFDFLTMIPIFYVPFGAILAAWSYSTMASVKNRVDQAVSGVYRRLVMRRPSQS